MYSEKISFSEALTHYEDGHRITRDTPEWIKEHIVLDPDKAEVPSLTRGDIMAGDWVAIIDGQ